MEEKIINAVKNWLEAIMTSVVGMYVEEHTEEVFHEMGKEEGIHGPFIINLEECNAPVTAINFYAMVVNDIMMFAATADVKNAHEGYVPDIKFEFVFRVAEFAESVSTDENIQKLVSRVIEICKEALE
jgi:hypothetical protein